MIGDVIYKITVSEFAKKTNLSVDKILDLCRQLKINVDNGNDFLLLEDVKLLCDKFDDILPDINVFFDSSASLSSGGSGSTASSFSGAQGNSSTGSASLSSGKNGNVKPSSSGTQGNSSNSGTQGNSSNSGTQGNSSNFGTQGNSSLENSSSNSSTSLESESITSEGGILDQNINIDIDALCSGSNLVNNLKFDLGTLNSILKSITVFPPVDAAVLADCVSKSSSTIFTIAGMITRINNIKELLPIIDETANEIFDDDMSELDADWSGVRLDAKLGLNLNGPDGQETWYDLPMEGVVHNMEKVYGYTNLEYSVREDGVKLLSGVTPDGQEFKNLVLVAAHVQHPDYPDGNFQRGQIVQTSLGWGIVADQCGRSADEWRMNKKVHFDIATSWRTGKYEVNAYDDYYPIEYAEQIIPGQKEPIVLKFNADGEHFYTEYYSPVDGVVPNLKNEEPKQSVEEPKEFGDESQIIVGGLSGSTYSPNIKPKNNSDIAHRGNHPGGVYENSVDAFRTAGENGFWGCETDVRFDSGGNLVCSHNAVKFGEEPPSFEEYLDICKEYGMTAVIDLKYEKGVGPADPNLSPAILKTIEEKGMMDSCVLQTNNYTDIPYIRENSSEARIWYLTDDMSESNLNLIEENNVECVNLWLNGDVNHYSAINKLTENGIDVCVWGVQSEKTKADLLNRGATYVMSDNVLGITPYQEGEQDFNNLVSN